MDALNNFNLHSLLNTVISLFTAFVLGSMIGLERQVRQRTAGLRTNTLVAVGAAAFVAMGSRSMKSPARRLTVFMSSAGVRFRRRSWKSLSKCWKRPTIRYATWISMPSVKATRKSRPLFTRHRLILLNWTRSPIKWKL